MPPDQQRPRIPWKHSQRLFAVHQCRLRCRLRDCGLISARSISILKYVSDVCAPLTTRQRALKHHSNTSRANWSHIENLGHTRHVADATQRRYLFASCRCGLSGTAAVAYAACPQRSCTSRFNFACDVREWTPATAAAAAEQVTAAQASKSAALDHAMPRSGTAAAGGGAGASDAGCCGDASCRHWRIRMGQALRLVCTARDD